MTITSCLHTLFSQLLPADLSPKRVFDYTLHCACWLVHLPLPDDRIDVINHFSQKSADLRGEDLEKYLHSVRLDDVWIFMKDQDRSQNLRVYAFDRIAELRALENIFDEKVSFKPLPPLSARVQTEVAFLQFMEGRTMLFLPGCRDPDGIMVLDPGNGRITPFNVEGLARLTRKRSAGVPVLIVPAQITEVIVVCLDCSGSMQNELDGHWPQKTMKTKNPDGSFTFLPLNPSRIDIARQYLTSFANRLYGFRIPCLLSLVLFASKIERVADFSPISVDFEDAARELTGSGSTLLWDAIEFARVNLEQLRHTGEYPKASHWRVLVFSDGNDEGSAINKIDLTNRILASNVFIDSVHLTTKRGDESADLARLSQITGGFAFRPVDPPAGMRLFEKESFLSARLRPPVPRLATGVTEEQFNRVVVKFEDHIDNTSLIHVTRVAQHFQTPAKAMAQLPRQTDRGRRVLDELLRIIQNPVQGIEVYLQEADIFEWKTFIQGPNDTPYAGRVWPLTVLFGEAYPGEPPLLRFSAIPYHMNVSEDGIVCVDLVTTRYVRGMPMREILEAVRKMFAEPQPRLAVQIEKLWNHRHSPDEYIAAAVESGDGAYNDMRTALRGVNIADDKLFVVPGGGGGGGGGGGVRAPPPVVRAYDYPDVDAMDPLRLFDAEGSLLTPDDDDEDVL